MQRLQFLELVLTKAWQDAVLWRAYYQQWGLDIQDKEGDHMSGTCAFPYWSSCKSQITVGSTWCWGLLPLFFFLPRCAACGTSLTRDPTCGILRWSPEPFRPPGASFYHLLIQGGCLVLGLQSVWACVWVKVDGAVGRGGLSAGSHITEKWLWWRNFPAIKKQKGGNMAKWSDSTIYRQLCFKRK